MRRYSELTKTEPKRRKSSTTNAKSNSNNTTVQSSTFQQRQLIGSSTISQTRSSSVPQEPPDQLNFKQPATESNLKNPVSSALLGRIQPELLLASYCSVAGLMDVGKRAREDDESGRTTVKRCR